MVDFPNLVFASDANATFELRVTTVTVLVIKAVVATGIHCIGICIAIHLTLVRP